MNPKMSVSTSFKHKEKILEESSVATVNTDISGLLILTTSWASGGARPDSAPLLTSPLWPRVSSRHAASVTLLPQLLGCAASPSWLSCCSSPQGLDCGLSSPPKPLLPRAAHQLLYYSQPRLYLENFSLSTFTYRRSIKRQRSPFKLDF